VIALCVNVLFMTPPAAAQTVAQADPIRELLTEVRALRVALERAATLGTRLQLLVARLQLQEQRVSELSRRLNDARTQLRSFEMGVQPITSQLESMEQALRGTHPPGERSQIEHQIATMKSQIEAMDRRRQEMTAEEAFLSQQLATEQGRWSDFNERLEQLERSLTPPDRH
jgi:predicted  nucleic acid-binding Zn-ribbon protein